MADVGRPGITTDSAGAAIAKASLPADVAYVDVVNTFSVNQIVDIAGLPGTWAMDVNAVGVAGYGIRGTGAGSGTGVEGQSTGTGQAGTFNASGTGVALSVAGNTTGNLQDWFSAGFGSLLTSINPVGVFLPVHATTAAAPAYVKGGMYFDTTLNKLRIGGATGWETVTSA